MAAVANEEKAEEGGEISELENGESPSSQKRSKHSKKHRHKHSKKHKHKHKKRKQKIKSSSRSRSRSSSRSRSRSPQFDGNSDDNSKFEATLIMNSDDITSFKLTKSRSPSPSTKNVSDANEHGKCEADHSQRSRTKSRSPPFYTQADLEIRERILARSKSKSPPCFTEADLEGTAQQESETKFKSTFSPLDKSKKEAILESSIGSKALPLDSTILEKNDNLDSQSTAESTQESTTKYKESEAKKNRSKSPKTVNNRARSKSSSRSVSSKRRKGKRSHSTSRSRSPRKKHEKKSRSRSSSYDKKRSRKKSRSRSVSSRSRSRSPKKSSRSHRSRSRDRRRTRSPVQRGRVRHSSSPRKRYVNFSYDRRNIRNNRSYRRSPSPKQSYSRRSRSPLGRYRRKSSRSVSPRRGRSRSPRNTSKIYSRRSNSRSRSKRSRSKSHTRRQRSRSKSHSRSKSREHSKRRSRSKSADVSDKKSTATTVEKTTPSVPLAKDLVGIAPVVNDPTNKRSLAQLTEFCKKLAEARGISEADGNQAKNGDEKEEEEDDSSKVISHPFLVTARKDITIPQVIFPVKPLLPPINMVDSSKPLTEQFPVSCGTKHHEKEETGLAVIDNIDGSAAVQPVFQQPQILEKLDISGLVVKRLDAQRRLQINPSDIDAMLALQEIEMKLNTWCQSNVKPGQYTGQLVKQMMPKEKFNSGYQAWAKKDMFHNLNPVMGGVGMKLLQKMGWEPGQVLGKSGNGIMEPIALTVKIDRKGLSSSTEKPAGKKGAGKAASTTPMDLQGKHPISLLQEFCARRKWQVPDFTLIFDEGPPHSKQFLFKVAVNGYEYQHPIVSGNKKQAKAQAAVAALKGLRLVPEDADF